MEIILLKDLEKVGDKHTIITVKNGFGRNYLIPQGLAIIANKANRQKLDDLIAKEGEEEAKLVGHYQEMAEKLKAKTLRIGAKAGTSGKIFGSVTPIQIIAAIKEQFEMEIPRRKVGIPEEVKNLGEYKAVVTLHPDVVVDMSFEVVAE